MLHHHNRSQRMVKPLPPTGQVACFRNRRAGGRFCRCKWPDQASTEQRGLRPDPVELTLALDVLRADPGAEHAWLAGGWPFAVAQVPDLAVSVVDEREAA